VISITNLVGRCSNYRLVRLQKMSEIGKEKLISRNGWPDRYQERNAFKPHCKDTTIRDVVASYYRALAGHGRDNAITPEEERGL